MKILQVCTLVSPANEYGGPTRVAINQLKGLRDRGHETLLIAAGRGYGTTPPREREGVPMRLFRALNGPRGWGFAGLSAPGMLLWLLLNARRFDVIHVHMARDFVSLPAAWVGQALGVPVVIQTHGMVRPSKRALAKLLDWGATGRLLRNARQVVFLTDTEKSQLRAVAGKSVNLKQLVNGVPTEPEAANAIAGHERLDGSVLYLARLHHRKQPEMFVRLAVTMHESYPYLKFELVGPDEGMAAAVFSEIDKNGAHRYVKWIGPALPELTMSLMQTARLYVLPSYDEPFPMSVLEAMSVGVPPVVSVTCGLSDALQSVDERLVFDGTQSDLEQKVRSLLADDIQLAQIGQSCRNLAVKSFGIETVLNHLEDIYALVRKGAECGK